MTRSIKDLVAALLAATFLAGTLPAHAAVSDFIGQWGNADPATRGIVKVVVYETPGQVNVHAWGACHPTACDWGVRAAQVFTENVGIPTGPGMDAAIVEFDQNGIQTMLLLQKSETGLSYKSFTIFTDGSQRSNYHNTGHFIRY